MNLLNYVQQVLDYVNSTQVNSINDTEESKRVATVVKNTYYSLLMERAIQNKYDLIQLDALSDVDRPTYLTVPDGVEQIESLRYQYHDDEANFVELEWMEPEAFLEYSLKLNPTEDYVVHFEDFSGTKLNVRNDRDPKYFTSFDREHILLDSFDITEESTIQAARVIARGSFLPDVTLEDTFEFDLSPMNEQLLLTKASVYYAGEIGSEQSGFYVDDMRKKKIQVGNRLGIAKGSVKNSWENTTKGGRR